MKEVKKVIWLIICVAVGSILVAVGCGGNDSPEPAEISPTAAESVIPETSPALIATTTSTIPEISTTPGDIVGPRLTASEIAAKAMTAAETIKTLKFDMDFLMLFGFGTGEEAQSINMEQAATAALDVTDKKMGMTMDLTMDVPDEGLQTVSAAIYAVDGWMYMKANEPGTGEQWSKTRLTEEMWAQQSQLSNMTDFLDSPVSLTLADSENIRGFNCYVLVITPDAESLADWMAGQAQSGASGLDMNSLGISDIYNNFSVKEWVAKDTFLPVRQEILMKFGDSSGEREPGLSIFGRMTLEMEARIDYYDYNKPVDIQLPPGALSAQEIPDE